MTEIKDNDSCEALIRFCWYIQKQHNAKPYINSEISSSWKADIASVSYRLYANYDNFDNYTKWPRVNKPIDFTLSAGVDDWICYFSAIPAMLKFKSRSKYSDLALFTRYERRYTEKYEVNDSSKMERDFVLARLDTPSWIWHWIENVPEADI